MDKYRVSSVSPRISERERCERRQRDVGREDRWTVSRERHDIRLLPVVYSYWLNRVKCLFRRWSPTVPTYSTQKWVNRNRIPNFLKVPGTLFWGRWTSHLFNAHDPYLGFHPRTHCFVRTPVGPPHSLRTRATLPVPDVYGDFSWSCVVDWAGGKKR